MLDSMFLSKSSLTRRDFLTSVAGAASMVALPALTKAAVPPVRPGRPMMKLSLAAYSFNRQFKRGVTEAEQQGSFTLFQFIDFCAELDIPGTELTSYYFPKDVGTDYLMRIKEQTFRLGLDISGTAIGNDFCLPEGSEREAQLAMCRTWIDHAATMGAPVIRIFAGKTPKDDVEEAAVERCVAGINACLDYASAKGVVLALENHGGITATPEQLLGIVEKVKPSPWFGINFDSGNFHTADPYADLEKIAPYAVNAQIKVSVSPGDGPRQPADYKRIVEILKHAGYRGYLALEFEENTDPRVEIPKEIARLRELIG